MNQKDLDRYRSILAARRHHLLSSKHIIFYFDPAEFSKLADIDNAAKKWLKGLLDEVETDHCKEKVAVSNHTQAISKPYIFFTNLFVDPVSVANKLLKERARECMEGFLEENENPTLPKQETKTSRRRALRGSQGRIKRKL